VLLAAGVAAVGPTAWAVARDLAHAPARELAEAAALGRAGWIAVGKSVLVAMAIALLAAALAIPAARVLARGRSRLAGWLIAPAMVPVYLSYSGYGLARAPGTALGDWLERAAEHGMRWAPILAGQTLAVAGLSLWATPLA